MISRIGKLAMCTSSYELIRIRIYHWPPERETGYKGEGKRWFPWWRQAEQEKNLNFTVEDIFAAAMVRWQWESGRRGEIEGGL